MRVRNRISINQSHRNMNRQKARKILFVKLKTGFYSKETKQSF